MKRTDALLEYAVQHGESVDAERLRAKLRHLAGMGQSGIGESACECHPVWNGRN